MFDLVAILAAIPKKGIATTMKYNQHKEGKQ